MTHRTVLAIDLGTTSVKCALYATTGVEVASATLEYELQTPAPGCVEVDVEVYWTSIRDCLAEVWRKAGDRRGEVAGLALSAQGETLVPVDAAGTALRPAIVWLDNRAAAESAELADRFPAAELYERTGQPEMLATWPAAKLLWLGRHEPEIAERTARYLLIEDYLLARMTGEYVTEGSLATSTCYWDLGTKTWWPAMLDALGVDADRLPAVVEPGAPVGRVRPAVAKELGLDPTTMVCAGALDQACGAIGGGSIAAGGFSENTGAAVAICSTLPGPGRDPAGVVPVHYHGIPDTYMFHTFSGGGIVLKWLRDEFCEPQIQAAAQAGRNAYDVLGDLAAGVPAGADGLLMLPHFQGAMAPENNEDARGVLMGLTLQHTRAHLVRALMEGIGFVVRRNVEAFAKAGVQSQEIRALGGGSRSAVWKQIEADITGLPVVTTKQPDAGALGAAILAGVGVGEFGSIHEGIEATVAVDRIYEPNPANTGLYDERFGRYVALYEALVPNFAAEAARP
ncbi:xylulokinase [Streptomyces fulvoviolaceus]|uniref:xylulokinase n=1 Tax=Streptomyces fulvoviolaceus TaxID=285535 RepID=UPI0004CA1C03|nr:FGGY family carbohydrate kinase [Streptomyces fulvoviolaceus]